MGTGNNQFPVGTQVRLVNDPLRIGVIIDANPIIRRGRCLYKIQFPDIVERIPGPELERVPDSPMDPLGLLQEGILGTPDDLRRALIHVRLTGRLADIIYSIEATNTTFYAYQFKPILKILQTPANGMLIADEVGLGKTIEAGLIWTELRTRFNLNRLFVVCPASLCEKWKSELAMKIGVTAEICNFAEVDNVLRESRDKSAQFAVISSMQGLRPRREMNSSGTNKPARTQIYQFLEDMENEHDLIDVLIVDEAHYMRNSKTATHKLGQLLRGVSTYVILLSATPVHNCNRDLHSLLCLIDPDMFADEESLSEILEANKPLIEARDRLLSGNPSRVKVAAALKRAKRNHLLSDNKQLKSLIQQFEKSNLENDPTRLELAYRIETINLLSHTITRTRKREVLENRVVREPFSEFVRMAPIEEEFYEMVTEIVTDYAIEQDLNESFLQVTPQQQMASCMPAALESWQDKRSSMEQKCDHWSDDPNEDEIELGPLMSRLVTHTQLFEYQKLYDSDSKYDRIREILKQYFSEYLGAKIIIFSTFRATVAYLSSRLTADGLSTIMLRGGDGMDKYEILRLFKSPDGPQVLLSTEVGGEGLDLQFCWAIINYDIPWNPMRLEQRIGRIDRLGQPSDKVLIWNLLYDDTIDSRIYRRLYEKLDLCRKALGDFEPIIGETLGRLTRELLTHRLTPKQQEERISQTALALEEQRAEQERLESDAASLVAYGEYILKEVRATREMQRWISSADLRFYLISCLDEYFPGYELVSERDSNDDYKLLLPHSARHQLWEFLKKNRLRGKTILNQSVTPTRCRFSNRSSGSVVGNRETISQTHPLIRFITHKYSEGTVQLRPAVAVTVLHSDLPDEFQIGTYLLAVSLWSIEGIRNHERLAYEMVEVSKPRTLLGNGLGERLASACVTSGACWSEASSHCDLLDLHDIANSVLFTELERRYDQFVSSEEALNSDRADVLEKNLRPRFERQVAPIVKKILGYQQSGKVRMVPAEKGKLKSLVENIKQQREQINDQRHVTHFSRDIAVAVVRVE